MSDVFTVDGFPVRIDRVYFRSRYAQAFPDLVPDEMNTFVDQAIDDTYTMFYGVNTLWAYMQTKEYYDKTRLCFGLLVAWYITDMYPEYAIGIVTSGGIPVKSKSIGGIKIAFGDPNGAIPKVQNYKDTLSSLKSNSFGAKAYTMITTSSAKMRIFGRSQ